MVATKLAKVYIKESLKIIDVVTETRLKTYGSETKPRRSFNNPR